MNIYNGIKDEVSKPMTIVLNTKPVPSFFSSYIDEDHPQTRVVDQLFVFLGF